LKSTKPIDILIATRERPIGLAIALTALLSQKRHDFDIHISDQSEAYDYVDSAEVRSLKRMFEVRGQNVHTYLHLPRRGIAEHRQFLLEQATAPYVLFLDDDVVLEPWVLGKLMKVIRQERCAFVGAFPAGLSFIEDIRPNQQIIEYWQEPVQPEVVEPDGTGWNRNVLHRAANIYHVAQSLPPGESRLYKVAWVAQCILYDRAKLLSVGGFSFWPQLPVYHSGEEVLVQLLLMRKYGGCAIIPSGTYALELPSTILNERGTVDDHALLLLPEMLHKLEQAQIIDGNLRA
jgi:GT2 family glycosyltransferase